MQLFLQGSVDGVEGWKGHSGQAVPQSPVSSLLPRAPPLWATTASLETDTIINLANCKNEAWQDGSNEFIQDMRAL